MPTRPAMARRWITAFVEPPMAAFVRIAFMKALRVRMWLGRRSSFTICTMRRPVRCAMTRRRLSTAGIAALPDSVMPSASTMLAMVLAVPIVLQEPGERLIDASASTNSAAVISPAFTASENFHRCVPDPIRSPRK